ncbi:PE family protein [Mycobacterium kansasii 732]|nr:PE family protein [Mycobacterium kansasii 732]
MSYVFATPEIIATAATDLAGIRSSIESATVAASAPTVQVQAAAADEISTAIAALFGRHALAYREAYMQARAFHERFVQALAFGASQYASAVAANVEQTSAGRHRRAHPIPAGTPADRKRRRWHNDQPQRRGRWAVVRQRRQRLFRHHRRRTRW